MRLWQSGIYNSSQNAQWHFLVTFFKEMSIHTNLLPQKDKRKKKTSHPNMIKWINVRATIFFNRTFKENQSVKMKYWHVFKRMCISDLLYMTLPLQKSKWNSCSLENLIILKLPSFEHFIWTSQIISCMLTKKTKLQFPLGLQIFNIYVRTNTRLEAYCDSACV